MAMPRQARISGLYECKNCVVHATDESKVVVPDLDGYIIAEQNGQLPVCSLK